MRESDHGAVARLAPTSGLLRHGHGLRRIVVFAEGESQSMIEIGNGLTQVPLRPVGLKESDSFQPISDAPGQALRGCRPP